MTRHTWRPGGATYYPMDGARQGDPLEPEQVCAALDAWDARGPIVSNAPPAMPPIKPNTVYDSSAAHWSPWLEWRGGPCPLPDRAQIAVEFRGGHTSVSEGAASHVRWRHSGERGDITRFRYHADNPAGWLPRGDWIPPAELWAPECPVRCEWTPQYIPSDSDRPARWGHVTHIRLVAREPQAGLPEGWWITHIGHLVQPNGYVALTHDVVSRYGPAAIRQAVDAWLREMGDE